MNRTDGAPCTFLPSVNACVELASDLRAVITYTVYTRIIPPKAGAEFFLKILVYYSLLPFLDSLVR